MKSGEDPKVLTGSMILVLNAAFSNIYFATWSSLRTIALY